MHKSTGISIFIRTNLCMHACSAVQQQFYSAVR